MHSWGQHSAPWTFFLTRCHMLLYKSQVEKSFHNLQRRNQSIRGALL